MQTLIFVAIALLMGMILSIYLPMNSAVSKYLGSTIAATVIFFVVALIASILILIFFGDYDSIKGIGSLPIYLFLPGLIAAFMVIGTTFLIPKIGARTFFILLVSGQIFMAIIVSHFGVLESTTTRTAGGLDFTAKGSKRQGREVPQLLKTTRWNRARSPAMAGFGKPNRSKTRSP